MTKRTKRTTKKTATKRAKRKKKTVQAVVKRIEPDHHPDNPDTQVAVWETYAVERSARATAEKLGVKRWIVREIIQRDRHRVNEIIDANLEMMVASWEHTCERAHRLMGDLVGITEGMILEIKTATIEGRMTTIRDRNGYPMSVLDATQFLVMSRLLDQTARIAERAQEISTAYRRGGQTPAGDDGGPGGPGGIGSAANADDIDTMSDRELARIIKAGRFTMPPLLAKKLENLDEADKVDKLDKVDTLANAT